MRVPRRRFRDLLARLFTCQDCVSTLRVNTQACGIVCMTIEHSATCPSRWLAHESRSQARARRRVA